MDREFGYTPGRADSRRLAVTASVAFGAGTAAGGSGWQGRRPRGRVRSTAERRP